MIVALQDRDKVLEGQLVAAKAEAEAARAELAAARGRPAGVQALPLSAPLYGDQDYALARQSDRAVAATNFRAGVGVASGGGGATVVAGTGSMAVPLGESHGFQSDAVAGASKADGVFGGAAHLFWRDPSTGALGLYGSYLNATALSRRETPTSTRWAPIWPAWAWKVISTGIGSASRVSPAPSGTASANRPGSSTTPGSPGT